MNRRTKIAVTLAPLLLLMTACGSSDDGGDAAAGSDNGGATAGDQDNGEVCTEDRVGGEWSVSGLALGSSLDPLVVGGGSSQTGLELVALYDSLIRFDEETGEFVGQVAESIEPNEDASEWTLHLREGVEFGNGDPLDAEAVKASTEAYIDPESESRMKPAGQFIDEVQVVDPLTVKFVLTEPWGFFPIHLAAGGGTTGALGMVRNLAQVEELGADSFGENPVGGGVGPYEVERWDPPNEVVLKAKTDWWGGPVCIQTLRFVGLTSGQARLDAMRTGELNMAVQYRDPVIAAEAKEEFDYVTSLFQGGQQLEFNAAGDELGDLRTRKAIALALDPEVVDQRAFGGAGLPGSGLVQDSDLLDGTTGIQYDPDEAEALVEELKGEGMELSFELIVGDQAANVESALAMKSLLDAVGFDITVSPINTADLIQRVYAERNFELAVGGQVGSEATLFASLTRFDSSNPANPYGFAEPEFDTALDQLREAQTGDELQAAVEAVQEAFNDHVPAAILAADEATMLWSPGIHGLEFTRGVTPYFDTAYIEE